MIKKLTSHLQHITITSATVQEKAHLLNIVWSQRNSWQRQLIMNLAE